MSLEAQLHTLATSIANLKAEADARAAYRFNRYFPDCQPTCKRGSKRRADHAGLCRELYGKHMAFIGAGPKHQERLFMAANRIGKTEVAAFEVTAHMTGLYPAWWDEVGGVRFDRPTHWWAAGDTTLSTRDILQVALLGRIEGVDTAIWSGMLHAHLVTDFTRKTGGIPKCVDQVFVKHVTGGVSTLEFKSYDQGRRLFQGTAQDGIWLDEEPPDDVYAECLLRLMTTKGLMITTLTPLQGMTPFIQQYVETAVMPDTVGNTVKAANVFAEARS
jgi:phage terminase large subunit-like protein